VTRHAAALLEREVTRRAAKARADVEETHAGRNAKLDREGGGRLAAADVELVDRREVRRRQPLQILARCCERFEDRAFQRTMRVVASNGLFSLHHRLPEWFVRSLSGPL
jgi:hypothetical protein